MKYEFKTPGFVRSTLYDLHDTLWRFRSSHVFQRIAALKHFSKLTGSTSTEYRFNKVSGLQLAAFLRKRLHNRYFTIIFSSVFQESYFEEDNRAIASGGQPRITYCHLNRFLNSIKWLLSIIPLWLTTLKSKQLKHRKILEC